MALDVRTVRKLTGLLLVVGVAYVAWLLSRIDRPPTVEVREEQVDASQLPATPREEMGCFDDLVLDWAGDRLEAGRACKRADGFSQLERVTLHLRKDDGTEQMVVRADRGLTSDRPGEPIQLSGNVRVETPDGLKLSGEALTVDKQVQQVTATVPVTFSRGELSGEAGRFVHDWKAGRTQLEVSPMLRIVGERTKGREVTLMGQRIDHDQAARRIQATGAALLEFPEGSIEANDIDVELSEDNQEVRTIVAIGAAVTRTTMAAVAAPAGGGPAITRVLRGARIEHAFGPGGEMDLVRAQGGARLEGASADPAAGITELLAGDVVELDLEGSPIALREVRATGDPARFERLEPGTKRAASGRDLKLRTSGGRFEKLVLIGAADVQDDTPTMKRSLQADQADIGFSEGGETLESLQFRGQPGRLNELVRATGMKRSVVARTGDLRFDAEGKPVAGSLDGRVEIVRGITRASADEATLLQDPQRTVLKGNAAVERAGRTSHGDEITIDETSQVLTVKGNQHTIVRDSSSIPGMAATGSDEPILIASEALVLREKDRNAVYAGGRPSLRRGDTELVSDRLVLDEAAGALDATGSITSKLRLAKPGEEPASAAESPFDPTRLVDGRADSFHHRRSERRVTYAGGAILEQEETMLKADRIDIYMTATEPARVERLEAIGNVFFESPVRGKAEGDRLIWREADDSVEVHGGARPARAVDADGNFQTGAVVAMTRGGVRALASPTGRARGSSPSLQASAP